MLEDYIRPGCSHFHTAPMTWRDLPRPPAILRMLSLWFDAVFCGVREAASLVKPVELGQFVRARMIIKQIRAILRHAFVLLAVRLEIKPQRPGAAGEPATLQTAHGGGGAAAARFPLWTPAPFSGRHPVFAAGEAQKPDLQHLAFPKSLDPGLGLWPPRDDGGVEKSLVRKRASLRAALLSPMPVASRANSVPTRSSSNPSCRARCQKPESAIFGKNASPPPKNRALG